MNNTAGQWQWDDVRFFLALAREGTLSGAARLIGVGHVTVGRRIAFLEQHLGVKLLNKTPDGFVVTSAGQAILKQSAAMEEAALDLERAAAGRDARAAGSVRLTAPEALAHRFIVPAIAVLCRTHPELQIDLETGVRSLDIARREADLAVRFARPTDPNLVCRKLVEVGFALYASRRYLAEHPKLRRGGGLVGHDLITFTGTPPPFSPRFMGESLDGSRTSLRCNNPLIQLEAAAKGLGIIELPCFLGDSCPHVIRALPGEKPILRPVWLIVHADLRRSARIKVVSSAIVTIFHDEAKTLRHGCQGGSKR